MKISFEKVIADSGSSFAVREKRERGFKGLYHFHPEIELTRIVEGSGVRLVGDDLSPFREGDLVLIGANLPHRYTSDPAGDLWARARVVQFAEDAIGGGVLHAPECREIAQMLEQASRGLCFGGDTVRRVDHLLERIFSSRGFERLGRMLELLQALATSGEGVPISSAGYLSTLNTFESDKVNLALDHIHRHMQEPITMGEVAARLKVSPATCNRLFRKSLASRSRHSCWRSGSAMPASCCWRPMPR